MKVILHTGSNLGKRAENLATAVQHIEKQVGSILGRTENNKLYIYNLNVSIENRRKKHGSEILNTYEALMKHNYGIENIYISALL